MYEEAVSQAKAALAAAPGSKIKGIIWHQGEGDNSVSKGAIYLERLKVLIESLRNNLGNNIPFIAGEVGTWNGRGKFVNPVIRKIGDSIPRAAYVISDGLTSVDSAKNDPHFDTYSQRVLGGRYADKTLEVVYNMVLNGATIYTGENFSGRSVSLRPGSYSKTELENLGISTNELVSLSVDKGCEVVLYPEDSKANAIVVKKDIKARERSPLASVKIKNVGKK